ncbi:hypothetical protein [Actinokineospora iranica]|nr:hypothetical protein [Actinokineospora iranica]
MRYWNSENEVIMSRLEDIISACAAGRGTPALLEEWAELTARLKAVGLRVEVVHARRQRHFLSRQGQAAGRGRGSAGEVW